MQLGIHLPQAGAQATPERIMRAALRADELGLADVWVSEHIIVPKDATYPPSPLFYDPVVTLSWVAAVTKRVRLGTSVLCCRCAIRCRWRRNWRRCTICRAGG